MGYRDYKADLATADNFSTSRALDLGANPGRAICGGFTKHTSITAFAAATAAGDSIPVIGTPITDPFNSSFTLSALFALIPTGGSSQVVNFTGDAAGQQRWPRLVVYDGISGYRAQSANSKYFATGTGTVDFTVDTSPGDIVVLVGDDYVVGRTLSITNAGATIHSGTLEFAASVPAAASGGSTRVEGSVSSSGNYRFMVVVLIPTGGGGGGGASSAVIGNFLFRQAERVKQALEPRWQHSEGGILIPA